MTQGIQKFIMMVLIAAVGIGFAGMAYAGGADDIKYRKGIMKIISGHNKAISTIAKGKVAYKSHLTAHADALVATGIMMGDLFPKGSGESAGKTRAKNAVWEKPEDFKKAVAAFASATVTLASAAKSGDLGAVQTAGKALGKSCGGCHKPFRAKKKRKKK